MTQVQALRSPGQSPVIHDPAGSIAIGIDVGGSKTRGVAIGDGGTVLAETRIPTRLGIAGVRSTIGDVVRDLHILDGGKKTVSSVGVGIPGVVDPTSGGVRNAVNLQVDAPDFGEMLEDDLEVPVVLENDVNVAALGAALDYPADDSIVLLNLGTGLAVGVVHAREIYRGTSGLAGEIGHLPLHRPGAPCRCGQHGCLELYVSGTALARAASEHGTTVASLLHAADLGDAGATGRVARFADDLAWVLQLLTLTFDAKHVVIGGGIATLGEHLLNPLLARLDQNAAGSHFLASAGMGRRVSLRGSSDHSAALGAAALGARRAASLGDSP